MAKQKLKDFYTQTQDLTGSKQTMAFEKGGVILTSDQNGINVGGSDNKLFVNGYISAASYGLYIVSDRTVTTLGATASISSVQAAVVAGTDEVLNNNGNLVATYFGMGMMGLGETLNNSGFISGQYAVLVYGDQASITNEAGANLYGSETAVRIETAAGKTNELVNLGRIEGVQFAFKSFAGDETLINKGQMHGAIDMGLGNDLVDIRGGTVDSTIAGGGGDDTLITDQADVFLTENSGAGTDTVRSTVTYTLNVNVENLTLLGKASIDGTGNASSNHITGNAGNNVLSGLAGFDYLDGGAGKDQLYGGSSGDFFIMATGNGKDVIMDFEDGLDQIDFHAWKAMKTVDDLLDNHMRQTDDGVLIHAGSDSLLIKGTLLAQITEADFVL